MARVLRLDNILILYYNFIMFNLLNTTKTINNNDIELYGSSGSNSKNVLIIGTTHGEEPQGCNILKLYLAEKITPKNNLFIIPCLNPDGYKLNSRTNANGVDLNRNFPTKNWKLTEKNEFFGGVKPASEIETRFMIDVIENIKPDVILSIHAPFKIVNYDGPAKEVSEQIAKIINYPVQSDIGYPTPGSFGTYCGVERNIPTITLELGEDEDFEFQKDSCFNIFEYLVNKI